MDPHRLAELRSLALHRAIARRLVDEPQVLDRARRRLEEWADTGAVHPEYAGRWARILARPAQEIAALIVRDDEEHRDLRQVTPFAGAIDPRERWAIWRETRDGLAREA